MLVTLAGFLIPSHGFARPQATTIKNQHFDASNPTRVAQDFYQPVPTANSPFVAPPKYKTVATSLRGFDVPFQINADNESFIEVQLYLSRDMGKTWSFHSRQTTDQNAFPFQAEEDGEYWFALKTLNRDRKLVPEGDPQIDLKIVVDSVKPELDFRIETDAAGRVVCRWRATDENIAPDTLRILYQPVGIDGQLGEWNEVPVKLSGVARAGIYADQLAWWPETTEQMLNVAVEIKDVAGNPVQLNRQLRIAQTGWRHQPMSTAQNNRPTGSQNLASRNVDTWSGLGRKPRQPEQSKTVIGEIVSHGPKVVCKDGVCKLVDAPDQALKVDEKIIQRLVEEMKTGAEFADPPIPEGYDQSSNTAQNLDPVNRMPGQFGVKIDNPHVNNQAMNGSTNNWPTSGANVQGRSRGNDSKVWKSETSQWNLDNQTSVASTMRPDPRIAPDPFPHRPDPQPETNVPSNPGTTFQKGDQVIGMASTKGATNQYRGMNSQNGRSIAKPTLLPGIGGMESNQWTTEQQVVGESRGGIQANNSFDPRLGSHNERTFSNPHFKPNTNHGVVDPQRTIPLSQAGFAQSGSEANAQRNLRPISPNRPTKAPMQIIGSKRFRLDYGIDSIDPSGVAKVDLWQTRDSGRTWTVWGSDPDNQSPFPVQVQEEGRYGFRVVVHSKDGLTGQGPSSGDDPDMWILVDTQSPLARISSVPYGRGNEAGRLVINYSVADQHLTLRPITLAYATTPQGPWNAIETGLRNEGRYVWKPTPKIPDRIFLRIDALDKAGNVGVHMLSQAIDVSGLVPRGTIHGVTPVGRPSPAKR